MPRPRVWSGLAESTQRRYAGAGISPEAYESGVSLKAARGHATTPERALIDVENLDIETRERYERYITQRQNYIEIVNQRKRELFGDDFKFRARSSDKNTRSGNMKDLRWAATASFGDIEQMAESGDSRWSFLWYH